MRRLRASLGQPSHSETSLAFKLATWAGLMPEQRPSEEGGVTSALDEKQHFGLARVSRGLADPRRVVARNESGPRY